MMFGWASSLNQVAKAAMDYGKEIAKPPVIDYAVYFFSIPMVLLQRGSYIRLSGVEYFSSDFLY
jgi:hypothetical protein